MGSLHIDVRGLEISRGHDGLFRGEPDPRILVATYAVQGSHTRLLRRERISFDPHAPYPTFVPCEGKAWSHDIPEGEHFVIVVIGLEEDGGDDIQRIHRALESADKLRVWGLDHKKPQPLPLSELKEDAGWDVPQRCELEDGTGAFSTSCSWDKWIGAGAWVPAPRHAKHELRVHLKSTLRRNDWTFLLDLETR